MRVLLINTSERIGGAAIAASRLMGSLKCNPLATESHLTIYSNTAKNENARTVISAYYARTNLFWTKQRAGSEKIL